MAALAATTCGGKETVVTEMPTPTTITVSPTSVRLDFINQTVRLTAVVLDQNGNPIESPVTWTSESSTIASVTSSGTVKAIANGVTRVFAESGTLSASVGVVVEQVASFLLPVSGDDQEAVAGTALPAPVVVRVVDRAGTSVVGAGVTFTPEATSGSVSATSATADAEGRAQTSWTLGSRFGPQTLTAWIDADSIDFSAFARSEDPIADLRVSSALTLLRSDPTSLESFSARATVRNDGDLGTGSAFRVALFSDGVEIATADVAPLAPSEEAAVELLVGPLAAGPHALRLVADADEGILELDETNNAATRNLNVRLQEPISAGARRTGLTALENEELLFRLDIPPGSPGTLTFRLSGGTSPMDADLFVEGAERPGSREGYDDCISAGPTSTETCQLVNASGRYHVVVHAFTDFSGITLEVALGDVVVPYDIEVVLVDSGTATQDAGVLRAAELWMDALVGDIPDVDYSSNPIPANGCIDGQPAVSDVVDDVRIFVVIEFIDGPGGTLASAGPCSVRALSYLPIVGSMRFDSGDLERLERDGDMVEVILHEMGHVLGVGTIWSARELLENPSLGTDPDDPSDDNPGADTHFRGPLAIAAFDAAGGISYTGGAKVPVENQAGPGSGDAHWRESVLGVEVMTPFLNALSVNPLSAITIESLADMGYGVDLSAAEAYSLPSTAPLGVEGGAGRRIDLRGDLRSGVVTVVDPTGRVVRVLR